MTLFYNGDEYIIEQVTGNIYRARCADRDTGVAFEVEHRGGGEYFKFRSAWKGERGYSAVRYSYKWIPIMREATFIIAQTDGLYDYELCKHFILTRDEEGLFYWRE